MIIVSFDTFNQGTPLPIQKPKIETEHIKKCNK